MKKITSVIDAQQFDKKTIEDIFTVAGLMEKKPPKDSLKGKILATLFYEPSTRTRLSFEAAMKRLGGEVIGTENAREFSSAAKGETLEDSIKIISGYADVIVLRYNKEGGARRAQDFSRVPVINAGDGTGQHPTQALLDLYTIKKNFGKIEGLKIAMVGDLTNGRTVRSLCYFLAKHYSKNQIYFISPEQTKMKSDIKEYLDKCKVHWQEGGDLKSLLPEIDVIYQNREQEERFKENREVYNRVVKESQGLIINGETLKLMKPKAIIMHPLPRIFEITYGVDKDKRAIYFQQAQNGLYVRMALLQMILKGY